VRTRAASPVRLEPGEFSVADGPDGTRLAIDAGGAGQLTVRVMRVLDEQSSDREAEAEFSGHGYVTALWNSPDSMMLRSIFATAELG
jgi:hypothetical protein